MAALCTLGCPHPLWRELAVAQDGGAHDLVLKVIAADCLLLLTAYYCLLLTTTYYLSMTPSPNPDPKPKTQNP